MEEQELMEWFKLNLPKYMEHNQPSLLTKEMFKNLHEKFDDIKKEMKEGFRIMHEKQDKTNGKVIKNTNFRQGVNGALKVLNIIMIPLVLAAIIKYLV